MDLQASSSDLEASSSDLEHKDVLSAESPCRLQYEQVGLRSSSSSCGSDLPEPPEEPLQDDCYEQDSVQHPSSDSPKPPKDPLQDCYEHDHFETSQSPPSDLPKPPKDPLQDSYEQDHLETSQPPPSDFPKPPLRNDCYDQDDVETYPRPPSSCLAHFPEPPEDPLLSNCCEQDSFETLQHPSSDLPEPPLQSDCCGTGCSPCVFDIYQEDLAKWKELAELTPEERAAKLNRKRHGRTGEGVCGGNLPPALSIEDYRDFEVVEMEEVCEDVFVYKFGLPLCSVLGVDTGQHMTLRYVLTITFYTRDPWWLDPLK